MPGTHPLLPSQSSLGGRENHAPPPRLFPFESFDLASEPMASEDGCLLAIGTRHEIRFWEMEPATAMGCATTKKQNAEKTQFFLGSRDELGNPKNHQKQRDVFPKQPLSHVVDLSGHVGTTIGFCLGLGLSASQEAGRQQLSFRTEPMTHLLWHASCLAPGLTASRRRRREGGCGGPFSALRGEKRSEAKDETSPALSAAFESFCISMS